MVSFFIFMLVVWIFVMLFAVSRSSARRKEAGRSAADSTLRTKNPRRAPAGRPSGPRMWTSQQPARQAARQSAPAPRQPSQAAPSPAHRRDLRQQKAMPNAAPMRQSLQQPESAMRVPQETILQRARANTAENFDRDALEARGPADLDRIPSGGEIAPDKDLAGHIHSPHDAGHDAELRNLRGVDDFDTYHLMDEVNDLIVKGYSAHLEFERDFIGEAEEMLGRMYAL